MKYSPESLQAFVVTAELGSFSAAARKLRKSQSTISTAVAGLEDDLGFNLFSRQGRYPSLTDGGLRILGYAREILAAADRMEEFSMRLSDNVEPRLTVGLTDSFPGVSIRPILREFAQLFPDIELEWADAEGADVVALLESGRAHVGLLAAQPRYPTDIVTRRLPIFSEIAVFVAQEHPLTAIPHPAFHHLSPYRQIYLSTERQHMETPSGAVWSATDYFMIMEMAELGFGWAKLPRQLVEQYGRNKLVELKLQQGPEIVPLDVAWSKTSPPGPAGLWFIDAMQHQLGSGLIG